jgi:hypothetical protein
MTPEAIEAIATFYFERYCRIWSQPELAPVLASIPSLMMWDDHDIFDGWGSWPPALQACPVYQSLWKSARDHFALFQQGSRPDQSPTGIGDPDGSHFGWAFKLGTIGIIAPDLRSNRTRRRMMDDVSWRWFETALTNLADCRHVLVVSTVPVANIDLSWIERILFWLPKQSYFQDDLRDQWQSYAHREEWRRLLQVLFDFSAQHQIRLSILSGCSISTLAMRGINWPCAAGKELKSASRAHRRNKNFIGDQLGTSSSLTLAAFSNRV